MREELKRFLDNDKGAERVKEMTFFGFRVETMDRDELLGLIGWLTAARNQSLLQHTDEIIKPVYCLNKALGEKA